MALATRATPSLTVSGATIRSKPDPTNAKIYAHQAKRRYGVARLMAEIDKLPVTLKEIPMIPEKEQIARRAAVQNALASQRMEGLEPEPQVQEDAQKWARGEKTISQAVADFKARLQRAPA